MKTYKHSDVGKTLLKILNSPWETKDLVDYIKRIYKMEFITTDEVKLCDAILEQIEVTSKVSVSDALDETGLYCDWRRSETYEKEELFIASEKYIEERTEAMLTSQAKFAFEKSGKGIFNKVNNALYFNRFAPLIGVRKETTLDDFINPFCDNDSSAMVSSSSEHVDNCLKGGFKGGKVTTILGCYSDISRSLWSLNIAYNAILQGNNVLYFTLGLDEKEFNKRLMLRHSYNLKFENELIPPEDDEETYDAKLVEEVCQDFYKNLSSNLIVFDESYFDISTVTSLQKLFIVADHKFQKMSDHGIDLVIIDDFTFMKLDNNKKMITNKAQIQTEYYSFLRNQSKNLLGTNRMIPIVVTNEIERRFSGYFVDNDSFEREYIPEVIESLSDNVLFAREDDGQQVKLTIIKPNRKKDGKYYLVPVDVCLQNWYMSYNNEDETLKNRRLRLVCDDSKMDATIFPLSNVETKEDNSSGEDVEDETFGALTEDSKELSKEEIREEMLK